jgi:2-polyprenyl-3-methyl-5-hydroxy-6-metoxy-1,4-benzoquinol methylase
MYNKSKNKFYWGLRPSPLLKKIIKLAPKGKALDIGGGEGRNSIFLAKNGFKVTAIDLSAEALEKLKNIAQENRLKVSTQVIDVRSFKFSPNQYSLIISISTLDFLKKSKAEEIIKKIKKSLVPEGIVYLSVFSTKGPLFCKIKRLDLKPIEENAFYLSKRKIYRHFFTQDELKGYFNDFEIILLKESCIKDTLHDQLHFHEIIEIIAKKH